MKILFLDHQGVMYTKRHPHPGHLDDFDKQAVAILNSILESDSSIEIVVSSDWKYWVSLDTMCEFYIQQGISRPPIGYTPKTATYNWQQLAQQRASEIKSWLETTTTTPTVWVAVDDINMTQHLSNFVRITETDKGLCQKGVKEEIVRLFNSIVL